MCEDNRASAGLLESSTDEKERALVADVGLAGKEAFEVAATIGIRLHTASVFRDANDNGFRLEIMVKEIWLQERS